MDTKKIGTFLKQNISKFKRKGLELYPDHQAPISRRDLLSCGFLTASYSLVLPSIGQILLSSKALSQDLNCDLSKNIVGVPVFQFHFGGGRRLWGDGLALGLHSHGKPGEYKTQSNSSKSSDFYGYGLAPEHHPSVSPYVTLGGHEMSPISYIYQSAFDSLGLQLSAIDKKLKILSLCAASPDDTRSSLQGILPFVTKIRGKTDFGIVSNQSGTNLTGLGNIPFFKILERADVLATPDIAQLVNTGLGDLDLDTQKMYLDSLKNLLSNRLSNTESQKILGCSAMGAAQKIDCYGSKLEPSKKDPNINKFFSDNLTLGSIAYMLLNNLSLAGALHAGGFDYHNGTSNGYDKDRNIFKKSIWPLINYFYHHDKPLIIYLTSDGATYSNLNQETRTIMINGEPKDIPLGINDGDRGQNGGAMFMFLNSSKTSLNLDFHQIGYGLAGSGMGAEDNLIANNDDAYASVAIETMRRAMIHLSPKDEIQGFQEITNGKKFNKNNLGSLIPIKEI